MESPEIWSWSTDVVVPDGFDSDAILASLSDIHNSSNELQKNKNMLKHNWLNLKYLKLLVPKLLVPKLLVPKLLVPKLPVPKRHVSKLLINLRHPLK